MGGGLDWDRSWDCWGRIWEELFSYAHGFSWGWRFRNGKVYFLFQQRVTDEWPVRAALATCPLPIIYSRTCSHVQVLPPSTRNFSPNLHVTSVLDLKMLRMPLSGGLRCKPYILVYRAWRVIICASQVCKLIIISYFIKSDLTWQRLPQTLNESSAKAVSFFPTSATDLPSRLPGHQCVLGLGASWTSFVMLTSGLLLTFRISQRRRSSTSDGTMLVIN